MQILHCTNRFKVPIFKSSKANEGSRPDDRQRNWPTASGCRERPGRNPTEFGRAYSSSQRSSDQIGNTPPPGCQSLQMTLAGPPPPAGVIVFQSSPPQESQRLEQLHNIRAHYGRVRPKLCIGRIGAILEQLYPSARLHTIFNSSIAAAHSSSQRPSIWIGDTPPPGCRSEQSDARWTSSPSERCLFLPLDFVQDLQSPHSDCAMRIERHSWPCDRAEACA